MTTDRRPYPSDLCDAEWKILEPLPRPRSRAAGIASTLNERSSTRFSMWSEVVAHGECCRMTCPIGSLVITTSGSGSGTERGCGFTITSMQKYANRWGAPCPALGRHHRLFFGEVDRKRGARLRRGEEDKWAKTSSSGGYNRSVDPHCGPLGNRSTGF
jgi:hypothetical protein